MDWGNHTPFLTPFLTMLRHLIASLVLTTVLTTPVSAKTLPIQGETFQIGEHEAFVILPPDAKPNTPWVWYAPTLPRLPEANEKWMFERFLAQGIAIAGIDVGESHGNPEGRAGFSALYGYLTTERGFGKKPCLLARSRGGLMLYNWAVENPDKVSGIAGIYPVCNLASYPGLARAASDYGMTAAQLETQLADHNPISRVAPLAAAGVPAYHIHGDKDHLVPLDKNTAELAKNFRAAGGRIEVQIIPEGGHDGWLGWFQSAPLTQFVIARALGQAIPENFGTHPGQPASLFNGKDLSGWTGDPEFWRVENGIIVGETTEAKPTKANTFLIWQDGEVSDFDLTLKGRVTANNSGIQYRSKVVNPAIWAVGGYQMDMINNSDLFGMLYEERGRGILTRRGQTVVLNPGAKPQVIKRADISAPLDVAEWNEYKIVARGNHMKHFVNGNLTAETIDSDPEKRSAHGVLAFQLHAGPPSRIELKDIVLTRFVPVAAPPASAPAPATTPAADAPQWIWNSKAHVIETIYARRQWTQREKVQSAELEITCDNAFIAYLNGKLIGKSTQWERAQKLDLAPHIKSGDNVLAIEAKNEGGLAGLVARAKIVGPSGNVTRLITNNEWQVSANLHEDWLAPSVAPDGWSPATVIAAYGAQPWNDPLSLATKPATAAAPPTQPAYDVVPDGFEIGKIYDVPKETQGSWVSMAVDDQGRLYCSDQNKLGIFRLTLGENGAPPQVEKISAEISGAQGLLWAHGSLYAGLNRNFPGAGLYRITDSDNNDQLDKVEALRKIRQGGEHGIHGVVLAPNGEDLFLAGGNHSPIPAPDSSAVPLNYGEDQLLPSMIDSRGHAKNIRAPGGWMARTDREGKQFRLQSAGFRNQYDMAFNSHGEMFSYDSDMEWDLGTPWYRPTRLYHVTSGAEFGWRTGSGKFPSYYPDVLPPALDIGPGSPTGVLSGLGAKFPAKYQNAIYAFDWTYGTIYALHQTPMGSTYSIEKEEFVTGSPLPLTDGVISPDGNFYFAVGGRGAESAIYRVRYTGAESTEPAPNPEGEGARLRKLRREMEALQTETVGGVHAIWPQLGHQDRFIRFAARVALEHQPVETWIDKALTETDNTQASLSALLALARQGGKEHQAGLLSSLESVFQSDLTEPQRLEALRILGLSIIRMGELTPEAATPFIALLSPSFPATSDRLNRELLPVLVALGSSDVAAKTVPLMSQESIAPTGANIDANLLARAGGGKRFAETAASNPPGQQIWYAYVLRHVSEGWTPELRQQYFAWFSKARAFKGGASFDGFLENIRNEALTAVPNETERQALAKLSTQPARAVPEGYENARELSVGVKPGLKFATELLTAKPGEKLALAFVNDDPTGMMHNLAIIAPDSLQKVITAALTIGEKAVEQNFIPDIPEVLASTPQVSPGRKFTLYFTVPAVEGDYPFVCTYPGHGQIMKGILRVAK